jgi:hypothetical protein
MPQGKEFGASDLAAALAYIDNLPVDNRRVYIDVQDIYGNWHCVYADERTHVKRSLITMIQGRSFRLRGTDIPRTIDRLDRPM